MKELLLSQVRYYFFKKIVFYNFIKYKNKGHRNGQVIIWEDFELKAELVNYKIEILNIVNCEYGVVIATDSATLYFVIL